ncbi:MAG: hypothetical protein WBB82_00770 [Limnothrix sp.]
MIQAFKHAVLASHPDVDVEIMTPALLHQHHPVADEQTLICPLTIDVPDRVTFAESSIFQACREINGRRRWVQQQTQSKTCDEIHLGDHWLPIIVTVKGPLYGEVIGEGIMPNSYHQPVDLNDQQRQQLYQLGYQLLASIGRSPGVYLLQFAFSETKEILFDRLWPFPAAPAIASLSVQQPDLFTCHWRCLTHQKIDDIIIANTPD